jgi:xylose isomerase
MKNATDDNLNYGFIAQEVEAALAGKKANMVLTGDDAQKTKTMRYTDLIAPLVKAIQEQQKQIDELNTLCNKLESTIKEMAAEQNKAGNKSVGSLR